MARISKAAEYKMAVKAQLTARRLSTIMTIVEEIMVAGGYACNQTATQVVDLIQAVRTLERTY
jgi:hypothetical protein